MDRRSIAPKPGFVFHVFGAALCFAALACTEPAVNTRDGLVGGRVLIAPGAGLAHAQVAVDQVNLYDGKAEVRVHVGDVVTDEDGEFGPLKTNTINGLISFTVSGGSFTDPISGNRVQLDPSQELKAVHWLALFEDRSTDIYITPVHSLIAARFRSKMPILTDTIKAVDDAYLHLDAHLGGLDWDKVVPADLTVAVTSPTDEVRAAFVLGGLSALADDVRAEAGASIQVVNVMTLVAAMEQDLSGSDLVGPDLLLDGNDGDNSALGSGLQVGDCAPVSGCAPRAGECLGACRPKCDVFSNTYRNLLAGAVARFIGSKENPTVWNHTTLSILDAQSLISGISRNADPDLFGPNTCVETADRTPPTIVWQAPTPEDGAVVGGSVPLRFMATDETDLTPKASFPAPLTDTDGDATNNVAVATLDTQLATDGHDQELTVTAVAMDSAGNQRTATRTFQVDNTKPTVTLDDTGFLRDGNVWWTGAIEPMLHGTINDVHPSAVEVMIGGAVVASGTVSGTTWSATLREGVLTEDGNDVTIRGIDQAGNAGTIVQTMRLDKTPPSITVDASPVSDEANSTLEPVDNPDGSRFMVHTPGGAPVDLATTGSCPTIRKYAHLLSQPGPGGAHTVLGSSGVLNPLTLNVIVSDAGLGVEPGTAKYRVGVRNGAGIDFLTEWTAMPGGTVVGPHATRYSLAFYRDGATGIPALATRNGEYHVELQAKDRFAHERNDERCWTHAVLAPKLKSTNGSGEKAENFQRALFSTSLNPAPNQTGDFAAKFLNDNAAGAALWRWRLRNYLGIPVYVTVQISRNVQARVDRQFAIRHTFKARRTVRTSCGVGCPVDSTTDFVTTTATQHGLALRARLFVMNGAVETGAEIGTCPGCTADDTTQTYVFEIPARTAPQGSALPEYAVLTYLRPTLPDGEGTNVLMAPKDMAHPDDDGSPYAEFTFPPIGGATLTGKLLPISLPEVCTEASEEEDNGPLFCHERGTPVHYLALTQISYSLLDPLKTTFTFSATPLLPPTASIPAQLFPEFATLTTNEGFLP